MVSSLIVEKWITFIDIQLRRSPLFSMMTKQNHIFGCHDMNTEAFIEEEHHSIMFVWWHNTQGRVEESSNWKSWTRSVARQYHDWRERRALERERENCEEAREGEERRCQPRVCGTSTATWASFTLLRPPFFDAVENTTFYAAPAVTFHYWKHIKNAFIGVTFQLDFFLRATISMHFLDKFFWTKLEASLIKVSLCLVFRGNAQALLFYTAVTLKTKERERLRKIWLSGCSVFSGPFFSKFCKPNTPSIKRLQHISFFMTCISLMTAIKYPPKKGYYLNTFPIKMVFKHFQLSSFLWLFFTQHKFHAFLASTTAAACMHHPISSNSLGKYKKGSYPFKK